MRNNYFKTAPEVAAAMLALEKANEHLTLPQNIKELIKLRASQINGCAYCVDMHFADMVKMAMDIRKINAVCVWRETPFFDERERMALLWTETLTEVSVKHAPIEIYEQVAAQFNEQEMAELTLAIATINAWNRFGVGFGFEPKA
ncbi:carboxymuconolactone decarboxylase family protein [Avibacterium sp. 20-126]|uniref:carboxymuconolactone decarboxylase family protein n=1 Tax=Avibacterium sp. 20-126 TaxID=2911524 RepID=UPI0021888AD9|nr:carboxymuconolactone decarboxylase family protein [Avibacterium sp. 20-126]